MKLDGLMTKGVIMKIQGHDPRMRWPRAMAQNANSNFSPTTGRMICRVLRGYDFRTNPYPTVAVRGAEIERLMHLPTPALHVLGLDRAFVVHHILHDILPDRAYSGASR